MTDVNFMSCQCAITHSISCNLLYLNLGKILEYFNITCCDDVLKSNVYILCIYKVLYIHRFYIYV